MANYIQGDVLNVAAEIQTRYGDRLKIKWVANPTLTDAPYKIVEIRPDGQEDDVLDVWELDDRVLHKLHAIDNWRQINSGQRLLNREEQQRRVKELEKAEAREQNVALMTAALKAGRAFTFHNSKGDLIRYTPDKPTERVRSGYII